MTERAWLWPAEWSAQEALIIAWPTAATDWAPRLAEVEPAFAQLAAAVTRFQPLLILATDATAVARAQAHCTVAGADPARLRLIEIPYQDTWLRDSGPITLLRADGQRRWLDFRFTGWGGKFDSTVDDQLVAALHRLQVCAIEDYQRVDFALEGGAIESDGAGTLLTTAHCLASRHPSMSEAQIGEHLGAVLGVDHVLSLHHGVLEGDDTDAHIDTLARFVPDGIAYQSCDDPSDAHFRDLALMAEELRGLRDRKGNAIRLHALPWPRPIHDPIEGRRLAASYANFVIINDAVLLPTYRDPADRIAEQVLARCFPNRTIVPIDARPMIWQNGSLHCLTMQIPRPMVGPNRH